ncbi:MAG: glutamate ABC transporter substrate-binding protein [Tepidiformaceae bacterium]
MLKRSRIFYLFMALFAMTAFVAMACGDDDDDDDDGGKTTTAPTTAAAPTFAAGSTMANIQAKGKLVVGVKFDQPGFGLKDATTGKVDGFDVAMAKEIGKALGLKEEQIEFVEAVSANRIPFLAEDKVDLILATMTINAERKTQIEFSRPYYLAGQSILVKNDNTTIKTVTDLNGKKVCSVQGSTSEKNVVAKAPQTELLSLATYSACVSSMKDGRVEAVTTDDIILAGFAAADKTLKLVGGQFTQEPYGIGMKKGKTDMTQFVDALLADMFKDGRWDKIYDKYLGAVAGLPKAAELRAKLPPTN